MSNQEEFLSSTTTDKAKYIRTWKDHINQIERLGSPLLDASITAELYEELRVIKSRLIELVEIAADEDFR